MAGIEKICEFSDEYPGHLMYGYKKNSIQIMPQFRKLFRGADAELHIEKAEVVFYTRSRRYGSYSWPCASEVAWHWDGDFESYLLYELWDRTCLRINYTYTLKVANKELAGTVEGNYLNWSFDISTVVRKLRRMVGPHLKVVNHVGSRANIFKNWRAEMLEKIAEEMAKDAAEKKEKEIEQ